MERAETHTPLSTLQEELLVTEDEVGRLESILDRSSQGYGIFRSSPLPGAFALEMHDEARLLLSWIRYRGAVAVKAHGVVEAENAVPDIGLEELRKGLAAARSMVELLQAHDALRERAEEAYRRIDGQLGTLAWHEREARGEDPMGPLPLGTPGPVQELAPIVDHSPRERLRRLVTMAWRGLCWCVRMLHPKHLGGPLMISIGAILMVISAASYEHAARTYEISSRLHARSVVNGSGHLEHRISLMSRKLDALPSRIAQGSHGQICDQSIESIAKNVELISRRVD